ncbi:PAS domain-containing protein [Streptomyces sp. NPDC046751]|uniref:PAS domain-containing protein n=1 Tax=Streptomyces sp. NPDC046751 TaxID=3160977 RepID=UPI0033C7738F
MNSSPFRGAGRLAAPCDALPDGLVLVNSNGTIVNANTMALAMFEVPGTALVGRGLFDLLPGFDPRLLPGSIPRPDGDAGPGRTAPERMVARRADGSEFAAEVTGVHLDDRSEAYDSYQGRAGDRLLMLVLRDLAGTLDVEGELARSRRQLEMVLRAASEGVIGTDADGRVVLVNPAAAQVLGYRASELGGRQLHSLILHSRADGEPHPYEGSPLADTLASGRRHRVRGQVLWARDSTRIPVDITTAPIREGGQLVGAVLTFTDQRPYERLVREHEAELADHVERHHTELGRHKERYAALAARHAQLTAVLDGALHGTLEELRTELVSLAADDGVQLWPEANQLLHRLAAGYARMTALVNNVLGYQRLDAGTDGLHKDAVLLDRVVDDGIDGAVELIGPGLRFSVDTPPVEAEIDPERLATALAHLVADVAGVGSAGGTDIVHGAGEGRIDSTITVAAARRGDMARIEVRGPHAGGDPVHQPIVRGIIGAHGGVVRAHEVPETGGGAYVLDIPLAAGRSTVASAPAHRTSGQTLPDSAAAPSRNGSGATGRRRGRPAEGVVVTAAEGARRHAFPVGDVAGPRRMRGDAPTPVRREGLPIGADGAGPPAPRPTVGGRHALVTDQEWAGTAEAVSWPRFGLALADAGGFPGLTPAPVHWPEPGAVPLPVNDGSGVRAALSGPYDDRTPPQPRAQSAQQAPVANGVEG